MREGLVLERANVNQKSTFDLLVGLFLFKIEVIGSNLILHGIFFYFSMDGWHMPLLSNRLEI